MATTATLLMPYPVLSAAANVPSDMAALANRIETVFAGTYAPTPQMIRVKNPSDRTSFGAGSYELGNLWTVDYTKGSGMFTFASGVVTVVNAGIYNMSLNLTCSAGSSTGETRLANTAATTIYCRTHWPAANMVASCSATAYLAAGTTIAQWTYNSSGLITINADAATAPSAFTVTRLSGA